MCFATFGMYVLRTDYCSGTQIDRYCGDEQVIHPTWLLEEKAWLKKQYVVIESIGTDFNFFLQGNGDKKAGNIKGTEKR